jgi:hypothetical protein
VRTDCEKRGLGIRHREYKRGRSRKCNPER